MGSMKQPNFLVILADDLGYSDIGCFGSEIRTPNIDALARDGARFTDYHTASACSPTRAMLMSGTDNHIAGVGVMSEQKGRDPERWNVPGHEGFLNHDVAAVSEILQDAGYHTLISGKWHLGLRPENNPAARGFDRSFALLPGTSNHYGWEPQFGKDYTNFFVRIPLLYTEDGKRQEITPNLTHDKAGFFSSDYYTDNLIKYLEERKEVDESKPFFAYLPFSAPHWPLQCSKEDRERYRGLYDDGPDALRLKRLERMKELNLIPRDVKPHDMVVPQDFPPEWDQMTDHERKCSARAMECFAGMVDNIDQNVGKMVDYLKRTGEFENTMIIFQSDNGAEGATYEALPTMGADLMRVLNTYYDNSLDNIGNATSFAWYGTRWAQASTAPSRLFKMYTTEGGIKVPFVVHYPRFAKERQNGSIIRGFSSVMDICPTILDLAGVRHPAATGESAMFQGRKVAPMRGKSWVPFMTSTDTSNDSSDSIHDSTTSMGWELFGRAAIRKGKYKLVNIEPKFGGREDGEWQLYDLSMDQGEIEDLSESKPEVVQELLEVWEKYRKETGVVWGQPIRFVGEEWDGNDEEGVIGGDAITQTRAWMKVTQGGAPPVSAK